MDKELKHDCQDRVEVENVRQWTLFRQRSERLCNGKSMGLFMFMEF